MKSAELSGETLHQLAAQSQEIKFKISGFDQTITSMDGICVALDLFTGFRELSMIEQNLFRHSRTFDGIIGYKFHRS